MSLADTIYALASGVGRAGIAVVRVSGAGALESLSGLRREKASPSPRQAVLARLADPLSGGLIDEAIVIYFKPPHSYTGEDVIEYQIHGGKAVRESLLEVLARYPGHRMAEPGEFTRRAFENGRMDLTQAEAVADLIHAETEAQKQLALAQMGGALTALYEGWAGRLVQALAYAEAQIDFSEEDLPEDEIREAVMPVLQDVSQEIKTHLDDGHRGERLRDGIRVAVVGAPNAGKSSLVNALARRDVAIVSDMAGTTRDVLEVHLDLAGFPVILYDTAGLRPEALSADKAQDRIEAEGIRRALRIAREADFKILLFDATEAAPDKKTLDLKDKTALLAANKIDKAGRSFDGMIGLSAQSGAGLQDLISCLTTRVKEAYQSDTNRPPSLTRSRHREALTGTLEHIRRALDGYSADMIAEDIRLAVRSLGRITGRTDVEDLLDIIFRDFCIGK